MVDVDCECTIEWDDVGEHLAPEQLYLFSDVAEGVQGLEVCEVVKSFQKLTYLPSKHHNNNYRGDRAGYLDKERKTQQQGLLHGMRMTAA